MERRRYPRVIKQIPLRIRHEDYDLVGQTHDISCIGAYCTINKYIPVFSIISVVLLLPSKTKKNVVSSVRCKGVVVRIEENQEKNKEFKVAIYFNRLRQKDRDKISQYVQHFL